jgi:hypothetical protein
VIRKQRDLTPRPAAANDPVPHGATHDEAGVDLTLIRWMLGLPPRERLRLLQQQINAARRLQNARRTAR